MPYETSIPDMPMCTLIPNAIGRLLDSGSLKKWNGIFIHP